MNKSEKLESFIHQLEAMHDWLKGHKLAQWDEEETELIGEMYEAMDDIGDEIRYL